MPLATSYSLAHNNLFKGLGDNWTLEDLLTHGPALNGYGTPEDHYLSAAIGAIEMLKTGRTAAYDLFMSVPAPTSEVVEAVVRAYIDVGLRAVVEPAVAEDIQPLADAGAAVAHNPASILKLGNGIAPTREMLKQGLTIGLGTDGSMYSDNLNMVEAMRFAALVNKVRSINRSTRRCTPRPVPTSRPSLSADAWSWTMGGCYP